MFFKLSFAYAAVVHRSRLCPFMTHIDGCYIELVIRTNLSTERIELYVYTHTHAREYSLVPISFNIIARKDIAWRALPVLQRILMLRVWTRNKTLFWASFAFAPGVDSTLAGFRFPSNDSCKVKKNLQNVEFFIYQKISQRCIYVTQKYETCSKFEWYNSRLFKIGDFGKM